MSNGYSGPRNYRSDRTVCSGTARAGLISATAAEMPPLSLGSRMVCTFSVVSYAP